MYIAAAILSILLAFVVLVGQDLSVNPYDCGVVSRRPQDSYTKPPPHNSNHKWPQPRAGPLHRSGRSIGDRGLIVGLSWRPLGIGDPKLRTQAMTPIVLIQMP
jgi:hypothetical protein